MTPHTWQHLSPFRHLGDNLGCELRQPNLFIHLNGMRWISREFKQLADAKFLWNGELGNIFFLSHCKL
ncbi:hypothetical protein CEXT_396411 [Caerostris extrusa]|uniref:Uncharacterized protein n=1 Tax=Caerostris extrusa TaxID=172846 RepID=A0AAV4Y700_CAEEX|nr:hypothetical protein CEXT_396411 [Caerostris extrusa]